MKELNRNKMLSCNKTVQKGDIVPLGSFDINIDIYENIELISKSLLGHSEQTEFFLAENGVFCLKNTA